MVTPGLLEWLDRPEATATRGLSLYRAVALLDMVSAQPTIVTALRASARRIP